tara:strand:+ start:20811 stop:22091 length:1281 start_codon:yes stop_codon:yes gene_type:complete
VNKNSINTLYDSLWIHDVNTRISKTAILAGSPDQIIILLSDKLIAIDSILPVIMEIKEENKGIRIKFLFLRKESITSVKNNYIIWNAMRKIGDIDFLFYGGTGIKQSKVKRVYSILRLLINLYDLLKNKTLLFYRGELSAFPVWLLVNMVHRGGGAVVTFSALSYPISEALANHFWVRNKEPIVDQRGVHRRLQGDRHLVFHPKQIHYESLFTSSSMVVCGSSRRFPMWTKYLNDIFINEPFIDINGSKIDLCGKKSVAVFYPGNHSLADLKESDSCHRKFLSILSALSAQKELVVLLKPHVICDINELLEDIKQFPALDIHITNAHPQLLAKTVIAAFLPNGSAVMDDLYCEGVPIIESAEYIDEVLVRGGSFYPNIGRTTCLDDKKLVALIHALIKDTSEIKKPDACHLIWPKPKRISPLLWEN